MLRIAMMFAFTVAVALVISGLAVIFDTRGIATYGLIAGGAVWVGIVVARNGGEQSR